MSEMVTMRNPWILPNTATLVEMHVSWIDEGRKLSAEDKQKEIDAMLSAADKSNRDVILVRREDMIRISQALQSVKELSKFNLSEGLENVNPEVFDLKTKLFRLTEFPSMYAKQALEANK